MSSQRLQAAPALTHLERYCSQKAGLARRGRGAAAFAGAKDGKVKLLHISSAAGVAPASLRANRNITLFKCLKGLVHATYSSTILIHDAGAG
jgi:hypothetical protein